MKKTQLLCLVGFLFWLPIPWLYLDPPAVLAAQPLSIYAVGLFLGGVGIFALALHTTLTRRLSTRMARICTFLFVLGAVGLYQISGLAPNWDCLGKGLYVSVVKAQSGCTTTCTSNKLKPCSGWSTCWDKFVSCDGAGIDQDGRPCKGCCFSCTVTCPTSEPPPGTTNTPAPTATNTPTPSLTATSTPSLTPTLTFTPIPTDTQTPSPTPTPLPPWINGAVSCDLWGDAGWCRGDTTLKLTAGDPQGFDVVTKGDLNGIPFTCGSSCDLSLPEGNGTASYTVISASGRTANGSSTWQRDGTPPDLDVSLPAVDGRNGWYISEVEMLAAAFDSISGLSALSGSTDHGMTWISLPLRITDGVHSILTRARDAAGNEVVVSSLIHVDTVAPAVKIMSHTNEEVVNGEVRLAGTLEDETSGPAGGEISLDGGSTWHAVGMDINGAWSYIWRSSEVPNGQYSIQMRGSDQAGNISDPASINVIIDNDLPVVSMTDRWRIWDDGRLKISPNYFPIASVQVTIRDPQNRWPAVVMEFDPNRNAGSIKWDRRFADGTLAPSGEYPVLAVVCDIHDRCDRATGIIMIPEMTASTATRMPSPTATRISMPSATSVATQTPMASTPAWITPLPEEATGPASVSFPFWQLIGLLGLFMAIASASVADPRPAALRRLGETFRKMTAQPETDPSKTNKTR